MNATRRSIVAFAAAIVVSLIARTPSLTGVQPGGAPFVAILALGGALWVVGAYYGYEAIRTEHGA